MAKKYMREGIAAFRKKDFAAARASFMQAWELEPHADIAAALAEAEMQLGEYREAAEYWEYNLAHVSADREDATAQLAECAKHLGRLHVEVDPADAELDLDGVAKSLAPTPNQRSYWVEPGEHTLQARKASGTSAELKVAIAAGEEQTIRVSVPAAVPVSIVSPPPLTAALPPRPAPAPVTDHGSGIAPRTLVVIGGVTLTIAAAALGGWFSLQRAEAESQSKELLREVEQENPEGALHSGACADSAQRPAKCSDLFAKTNEWDRDANWAKGSFIAAGALGVATVATYLLWPSAAKRAQANALLVAPLGDRRTRGVQLRVAF